MKFQLSMCSFTPRRMSPMSFLNCSSSTQVMHLLPSHVRHLMQPQFRQRGSPEKALQPFSRKSKEVMSVCSTCLGRDPIGCSWAGPSKTPLLPEHLALVPSPRKAIFERMEAYLKHFQLVFFPRDTSCHNSCQRCFMKDDEV